MTLGSCNSHQRDAVKIIFYEKYRRALVKVNTFLYVYLLNEHKYAPIGEFDEKRDAIRQYYCYDTTECKKYKTVSLPMKILYKPLHGYYL